MDRPPATRPDVNRALLTAAFGFALAAPIGLVIAVADQLLIWWLYGVDAARQQGLFIAKHVPMTISDGHSDGYKVKEFQGFLHFVGATFGWMILATFAVLLVRRLLPRTYRRRVDHSGTPLGGNPSAAGAAAAPRANTRWVTAATVVLVAVLTFTQRPWVLAALSLLAVVATRLVPLAADEPPVPVSPPATAG